MTLRRTITLAAALAAVAACGDDPTPPEGGGTAVTADLQFLRPAATARPLVSNEVSFWAKKGEDREGRLYRAPGTSESDDFVRLRIRRETLLARPDGTPFATGDSVLITLRVIDAENLMVEMSPSGLRFSPSRPAELKFEFNEADDDLNRDGRVNGDDNTLRTSLQIWKRESPSEPWTPIVGTLKLELEEIEAELLSFTTYAVAYRQRVVE